MRGWTTTTAVLALFAVLTVAQEAQIWCESDCEIPAWNVYSIERYMAEVPRVNYNKVTLTFAEFPVSIEAASNLTKYITHVTEFVLDSHPESDLTGYNGSFTMDKLTISGGSLTSLQGFSSVFNVSDRLLLNYQFSLLSLDGLAPTDIYGRRLHVQNCNTLVDWSSLDAFDGPLGELTLLNINNTVSIPFLGGAYITGYMDVQNMESLRTLPLMHAGPSPGFTDYILFQNLPQLRNFGGIDFHGANQDWVVFQDLPKVGTFDLLGFNYSVPAGADYTLILSFLNVGGHINVNGTFESNPMYFRFINTGIRNFDNVNYAASGSFIGGFTLDNNPDLTSLSGLRGMGANADSNDALLNNYASASYANAGSYSLEFEQVFGITINNNPSLTSVDGLQDVDNIVGDLTITNNAALTSLSGLSGLVSVLDQPNSYSGAPVYSSVYPLEWQGTVRVLDNAALVDASMPSLSEVQGSLVVKGNPFLNLIALPQLSSASSTAIHNSLNVTDNGNCTDCNDVAALYTIPVGGSVAIDPCTPNTNACTAGNPCLNGGSCVDDPCDDFSFSCNCTGTGYPDGFYCNITRCGDGILAGNETCDDGNTNNGDGCESDCTITLTSTSTTSSTSTSSSSSTSSSVTGSTASGTTTTASNTATTSATATTSSSSPATTTTTTSTPTPTTPTTTSTPQPTTTTSPETESEAGDSTDVGDLEAEKARRNAIIGGAIGGTLGVILIGVCIGAVLTGACGSLISHEVKDMSGADMSEIDEESGSSGSSS